jgi:aspartate/methionine/tyrosine aminotransferase
LGDCAARRRARLRTRDVVDNANSGPTDRLAAFAWSQHARLAERARTILSGNVARARAFFAQHPQIVLPEPPSCSVVFARIPGQDDSGPFVQAMLDQYGVAFAPGRFFEAPASLSLAGCPEPWKKVFNIWDGSVFHRFCTERDSPQAL